MKYKHETNFIGMMLAALMFFVLIGTAFQLKQTDLGGFSIEVIKKDGKYVDGITGAVSGMERVSGFQTADQNPQTWKSPVFEFQDGTRNRNIQYTFVEDEWVFLHPKISGWQYVTGVGNYPALLSAKDTSFIEDSLLRSSYEKGLTMLTKRTQENQEGGWLNAGLVVTYGGKSESYSPNNVLMRNTILGLYGKPPEETPTPPSASIPQPQLPAASQTPSAPQPLSSEPESAPIEPFEVTSPGPVPGSTTVPVAPAQGGESPVAASEAPIAETIILSPWDMPFGTQPTAANDGKVYKRLDNGKLQRLDGNRWVNVDVYDITARYGSDSVTYKEVGISPTEIKNNALPGYNNIGIKKSTESTITYSGTYYSVQRGGKSFITNGKDTLPVPSGSDPDLFAQDKTDRAGIRKSYQDWLKQANKPDSKETRDTFEKYPPSHFEDKKGLIRQELGLTAAESAVQKKEKLPYEALLLPNGMFLFKDDLGRTYTPTDGNIPEDLQSYINFRNDHKKAVQQKDFKTSDGGLVYIENNNFIGDKGTPIASAIKEETIGSEKYKVTYNLEKGGKKTVSKINIEGTTLDINDNVLRQLSSNVKTKDDEIKVVNNNIEVTKTSIKPEGEKGKEGYRETTSTQTLTFSKEGLSKSVTTTEVKDNNQNTIELKVITQEHSYNQKTNSDVPTKTIEKVYTKSEGETTIQDGSSDFTEITTNSLTGEPSLAKIKTKGIEYSVQYKEDGVYVDGKKWDTLSDLEKQAVSSVANEHVAWTSRQFFTRIESALTSFRGLGFYASFFLSDKELDDLRESVDKIFAENYLGVEYWESALCAANIDRDSKGIAYVDTRIGLAAVAAHIEASRSEEIKKPDVKREFLYKITFNVKNGDWKEDPKALERMRFNIELRGEKTNKVLKSDKSLGRGETFGKIGSSAIVQFSNFQYNEICILFDEVPYSWSLKDKKLCNKISGPPSQPTKIDIEKAGQQEETAAEGEGEINDI